MPSETNYDKAAAACSDLKEKWETCVSRRLDLFKLGKEIDAEMCEAEFDLFRGCYLYHMNSFTRTEEK